MVSIRGRTCVFELVYPRARRVHLVGDFNGWTEAALAMDHDGRGLWYTVLELPPGTYRFRYFVDGQWVNDYAAFGLERNAEGQWDSILVVPGAADGEVDTMRRTAPRQSTESSRLRRSLSPPSAASTPKRQ